MKSERVVIIEDEGGSRYSIPLSSPTKLGLLHDPDGDTTKATGTELLCRTVGEMTRYKNFPRVIRATKAYSSGKHGSQSSVKAGEMLIIKDVQSTGNKQICVEAFSLLTSNTIT